MSYTPTTWETGDTITAEKLNNMESGISEAGRSVVKLTVNVNEGTYTLDKTWKQIHDFIFGGKFVYFVVAAEGTAYEIYTLGLIDETSFGLVFAFGDSMLNFTATSENGYPVYSD